MPRHRRGRRLTARRRQGDEDQAGRAGRAARGGRAELLRAGRHSAGRGRRRDRPADQPAGPGVRARGAHAGLAHAGPRLVRLQPSRQEAVRDGRAALRHRRCCGRTTACRARADADLHPALQIPHAELDHPQGLPSARRLLLRLLRGRPQDDHRAGRLPEGARPAARLSGRPGHGLLRGVVGARRAHGRLRGRRHRGRDARHRRRRLAGQGVAGHAARRRPARSVVGNRFPGA